MIAVGHRAPLVDVVPGADVVIRLSELHRRVRLSGIDALLSVHYPWLPEGVAWEYLEVETHLACKFCRDRLVEVYGHLHCVADALQRHAVSEVEVRINHRVKTCHMPCRVGVLHVGFNGVD